MTTPQDAPDIMSAEFMQDPYSIYATLLADHPMLWNEALQGWIITRFDDVKAVLKDNAFTTAPYDIMAAGIHGRSIVNMEGVEHSQHRQIVTPALRGRDLQEKYVPYIRRRAEELVTGFRDKGEVDLVSDFSSQYPINVIVNMLGLGPAEEELFQGWYASIMAFFYNLTGDPAVIDQGMRTKAEITEFILPIIAQRRANPGPDLLSHLCTVEVEGERMTDAEINAFVSLLTVAGGETTDKAISSMFKNLVERPDQYEAVRADRSLIPKAFAETLRFANPVHVVPRAASADMEIPSGKIQAGQAVYCMVSAANRDPRRWNEPNIFNIFRDDLDVAKAFTASGEYASFGLGRHFCVGAMLSKAEVEIAADLLLDAMESPRFTDGVPPAEEGMFARGPKSVRLTFTPAT